MKIIELLNKIANGEEVPKKIMYFGLIYEYCDKCKQYENLEGGIRTKLYEEIVSLNDEVEILDEPKEDKIENLHISNGITIVDCAIKIDEIIDKINELIDEVNKLKEK